MVKGRRHPSWSWKLFMLQLQVQLKIGVFIADCLNFALDYKGYDKNNKKLKQKNNLKFKLQLKLPSGKKQNSSEKKAFSFKRRFSVVIWIKYLPQLVLTLHRSNNQAVGICNKL